jgi:hypothetical protein
MTYEPERQQQAQPPERPQPLEHSDHVERPGPQGQNSSGGLIPQGSATS